MLVLGPYTNGHDAALAFIRKMKWQARHCDIVFCGSHEELLTRLTEGGAYAVVPVRNSSRGDVVVRPPRHSVLGRKGTMLSKLARLRKLGYDLRLECELGLPVSHCLLGPASVASAAQLGSVVSHPQALAQCSEFLERLGIAHSNRIPYASTGAAAKHAREHTQGTLPVGAIATRRAAKAYGLKILAEDIQDEADNTTHFQLIKYDARAEQVSVGIIGVEGAVGKALEAFFKDLGCRVLGADPQRPNSPTNSEVVLCSQVVIFALDIRYTQKVIRSVTKHSSPSQLFIDVTSVKAPAIREMLRGKAQVVGLHPMYAPSVSPEGQTIVMCPARLTDPKWKRWIVNVLAATGARIVRSEVLGTTHDRFMLPIQCTPQLGSLLEALMFQESGLSVEESLSYASPFYRLSLARIARLLQQSPHLYAGIAMENPGTVALLDRLYAWVKELRGLIKKKDYDGYAALFTRARKHFDCPAMDEARELFARQVALMNTRYSRNTAVLEFSGECSKPGLLAQVARVFGRRGINLIGIDSANLSDGRVQFMLKFDLDRGSEKIHLALEEFEAWSAPKMKVIA
jgi:prephenate dehydrogenase